MVSRFDGRVALISGIARGQGRSHALRFAREGAAIIGFDICEQIPGVFYPMSTPDDLAETVGLVEEAGGKIVSGIADVRDRASMKQVLDAGLAVFGRLDYVVANAGIMPTHGDDANKMFAWQNALDILLTGVMNTVELTYPVLVEQGSGGSIVIISSMAGLMPMMRTEGMHTLGMLAYSAAKAALPNLARNYASFLAKHNIRVNSVHPTGVNTPMILNPVLEHHFNSADPEDLRVLVPALPVGAVEPEDITNMVTWICSNEARYFTGNIVRVDGGASLR